MSLPGDSPIHQPIYKVRQGDLNHLPRLLAALEMSPLAVLLEKADDLTSCRTLVAQDIPYVMVFTNKYSIEQWRDAGYPHEMSVTAQQLCAAIKGEGVGIYLNPGDDHFGLPIFPKLFAEVRELMRAARN
jgi:hypothetical protein